MFVVVVDVVLSAQLFFREKGIFDIYLVSERCNAEQFELCQIVQLMLQNLNFQIC